MTKNQKSIGNPKRIRILMYHHISRDRKFVKKYRNIAVHIDEFKLHMEILQRLGYTTITFRDYSLFLENKLNLPKKPIILTFDDGYESIYKEVYPIMESYGMCGVIFVLGDKTMKHSVWDFPNTEPQPLLNEQQIIELHEAGFEIGSHSLTHADLTTLSREKAWDQISRSRMLLEILIGAPVNTFAYTYGKVNSAIKELVKEAGYKFACGTYTGPPLINKDHYEIRRILIAGEQSLTNYAIKLTQPYIYIEWLWWIYKTIFKSKNNKKSPTYEI